MQKVKLVFSLILVLCITTSMIVMPETVFAGIGENDYLVADFTDSTVISALNFTKDTEIYYENRGQSAKWTTSGSLSNKNSGQYYLSGSSTQTVDLSGMRSAHLIMYNEKSVGNQLNVLFHSAVGYFKGAIDLDWTGWKEIIIPISEFSNNKNGSWAAILDLQFNYAGWSAAFNEHSPIYFDSIWFEAKGVSVPVEIGENDYLVADFTDPTTTSTFKFTEDINIYYKNRGQSAKWLTSGSLGNKNIGQYYLSGSSTQTVDLSGMKALHLVMYNEKNVGNQMNIVFYTASGYFQKQIDLDWIGWKEVIIPVSEFSNKNNSTWAKVSYLVFNYNGWGGAFNEHSPVYFDSTWFEAKPVADYIEIANAENITGTAVPESAFSKNSEHKRLYDSTASWNGTGFSIIMDVNNYYLPGEEYLYQWVYSAEATNEEVEIRLANASDGTYISDTFTVDWVGWKLIELYTDDFSGNGSLKNANTYRLMSSNSKLCFDRIWFSAKKYATITASNLFATAGKVPLKDAKIKLKLSVPVSGSAKDAVKITEDGADFRSFEAETKGNIIYITIPELKKTSEYELMLREGLKSSDSVEFTDIVPIKFSAYDAGSTAGDIKFTDAGGSEITSAKGEVFAKSDVTSESGDTVTLVAAAYKDGIMTDIAAASGNGGITITGLDADAHTPVKAWVFSEKSGFIRRKNLPDNDEDILYDSTLHSAQSFSLNGVYQDSSGFILDMSYSGSNRLAVVIVSDSDGNVIIADDFYISSDMQYLLNSKNINLKQGQYNVKVSLLGDNRVYSAESFYINEAEEAEILAAVNNSSQYSDVLKLAEEYKFVFRLSDISDEKLIEHIAFVLFENKTYKNFDSIHETVSLAKKALEELNAADWSSLEDYFKKYDIALGKSAAADSYNSLTSDERIGMFKELVLYAPYGSFMELRDRVSAVISEYKKTGAFGNAKKPDVSGMPSGSDKKYWAGNNTDTSAPDFFIDLAGFDWASESIRSLLKKNVISMPDSGEFRPADEITRAEFVKILVSGIGLNTANSQNVFTDVKDDAWYAPYFAAAKKAGIVLGYDDGTVAPDDTITRQDMAVIIKRAMDASGIDFTVINENYRITDLDDVGDYALDAVRMVLECGLMQGIGGRKFDPKALANRASAAVVILRLMQGIQAGGIVYTDTAAVKAHEIIEMPEYKLMNRIGIIENSDSICSSSTITRRELARVMYKLAFYDGAVGVAEGKTPLEDVRINDPDYTAINMMYTWDYMTAVNGKFRPDEAVYMDEFVRAALYVLGYNRIADSNGGYPVGYMKIASELKLTQNGQLDSVSTINNQEFVNLIYNVLEAPIAEFSKVSGSTLSEYTTNEYNTLLYDKFSIYKIRGLLESDVYSDILSKKPRASKGSLIISGIVYQTELDNVNELVGHMTEAYVSEESETVVSIASYKTEETIISGRDVNIESTRINYSDEVGKSRYIKLSKNVTLLYNGRQTSFKTNLFENINGTVAVIDNDEDGIADIIKIYNYQTLLVNNVSVKSGIIADGLSGNNIVLDKLEPDKEYLIYKNGKKSAIEDIAVDDVISYTDTGDASSRLIVIYACDNTVTGVVESISDDEAVIGEKQYYLAPVAKNRILIGTETKFHLDFMGQIVAASTALDIVYGYLYSIYENADCNVSVRIFTENDRWVELELKEKVSLNDKRKSAEEVLSFFGTNPSRYRQLVRYNVDDDAKVIKIQTANEYKAWSAEESEAIAKDLFRLSHSEESSKYRGANKSFGQYMPVTDATKIFLVPPLDSKSSMEDCCIISMSALADNRTYAKVSAYNADETFVPEVIVIHDSIDNVYTVNNSSNIASVMVVTKVLDSINRLDEPCYCVIGSYGGSPKVSFRTKDMSLSEAANLKEGDIVQLAIDSDGYIVNISRIFDADNGFDRYISEGDAYSSAAFMAGEVKSVDANTGRMVIQCDPADKGIAASIGSSTIYIYDAEENEVSVGNKNDILVGDRVFLGARYLNVSQIVIFR